MIVWGSGIIERYREKGNYSQFILFLFLINDNDPHIGNELLQRFRKTLSIKDTKKASRTVMKMLQKAEAYTKKKDRQIAEQKAKGKALKEKEAAIAREKHLNGLAGREKEIWKKVDTLILTKKPKDYDEAVRKLNNILR